ncbi:hypothetical protein E8E12_004987 [Didymella heteroderae]|uniref:Uncharacterized protein n=1 Tax=Didymella heteroderae TaxID=1769908 RepID=A0A9P4WWH0_9PLEO|nr:hypothetical protein E8E12_004987 [Didymella heteroderae]
MTSAPSPSLPPRRTEFFILNAGKEAADDVWMFADMIAIIKEMTENFSFTGTAWNLFPYNEYFDSFSKGEHKGEVWWGYKDNKIRSEPLLKFKKGDQPFWKDLDWENIPNLDMMIIQHIEQRKLNPGDRFNVFIIGHSQKANGIEVGNQILKRPALAQALGKMKTGVQVSVIISTCWSGKILNQIRKLGIRHQFVQTSTDDKEPSYGIKRRVTSDPFCRGSSFLTAFLGTMPAWQNDDPAKERTVGEKGVEKSKPNSIPQADTNNALHVHMVEVMYDRYMPFKRIASSEQREEIISPTYPAPLSLYGPSFDAAIMPPSAGSALNVVQKEFDLVSTLASHPRDMKMAEIMGVALSKERSVEVRMETIKELLQGLRWRFAMQERLIVLWDLLKERGFIDAEAIMRRMDLCESNPSVTAVEQAFFLFEYAHDFSDASVTGPKARFSSNSLFGRFEHAITWLAVLILRSGASNVAGAIRFTKETGLLGDFDLEAEIELQEDDFEFKGGRYLLCSDDAARPNDRIGMILPHGESLQRWAAKTINRYADLRRAYCEMFGPDSWPLFAPFTLLMKEIINKPTKIFENVLYNKQAEWMERQSAQSGKMAVLR